MLKARPRPAVSGVASADRVLTVLTAFRIGDTALSLVELAERTRAACGKGLHVSHAGLARASLT